MAMTDLRGTYARDWESEAADTTPVKIGAAIIIVLALGALGAYFFGAGMLQQQQPARLAMTIPAPAIPVKPVIAPKIVTPTPAAVTQSSSASDVVPATTPTRTHARKPATQQNADLQPAPIPAAETPATAPAPDQTAPEQPAAPTQPASQP
jgi:cytoskeletal protein RodZ